MLATTLKKEIFHPMIATSIFLACATAPREPSGSNQLDLASTKARQVVLASDFRGVGPFNLGEHFGEASHVGWRCQPRSWAYECEADENPDLYVFVHVYNDRIVSISIEGKGPEKTLAIACSTYSTLVHDISEVFGMPSRAEWACQGKTQRSSCAVWRRGDLSITVSVTPDMEHMDRGYMISTLESDSDRASVCLRPDP